LKVQYLSKKDVRELLDELRSRPYIDKSLIDYVQEFEDDVKKVWEEEKFEIIVFGSFPTLFKSKKMDSYIITLYAVNVMYNTKGVLVVPAVVVDEGAVPHIKKGADVMLPGIKKVAKPFMKGDVVAVLEPSEKYAIALGIALVDSASIVPGAKGKGIKNVNYLDDDIWRACLQVAKVFQRR
jgi:PUA domain protein